MFEELVKNNISEQITLFSVFRLNIIADESQVVRKQLLNMLIVLF